MVSTTAHVTSEITMYFHLLRPPNAMPLRTENLWVGLLRTPAT